MSDGIAASIDSPTSTAAAAVGAAAGSGVTGAGAPSTVAVDARTGDAKAPGTTRTGSGTKPPGSSTTLDPTDALPREERERRCAAATEAARTTEEKQAAFYGPACQGQTSVEQNYPRSSAAEVAAWWPYRPLFTGGRPPAPAIGPGIPAARSRDGSTRGDPRALTSLVILHFEAPDAQVEQDNGLRFRAEGGIALAAQRREQPSAPYSERDRPIVVRGVAGFHTESRIDQGSNVEEHLIRWSTPVEGGHLEHSLFASRRLYDVEELIRFADSLTSAP